jgi:hypothetical protein
MIVTHDVVLARNREIARSNAVSPLAQTHVVQLLESCAAMASEREAIRAALTVLSPPFGDVRKALNELKRIVAG